MARILSYCRITDTRVCCNGAAYVPCGDDPSHRLSDIYHRQKISYPKFFKMDMLCKSGFLAAEAALTACGFDPEEPKEDMAVMFINRASSLDDDRLYAATIGPDNYYPSPAVFVYTLANILTGEVAIRHKIHGETSFYVSERFDAAELVHKATNLFASTPCVKRLLCGWTEFDLNGCDALVMVIERDGTRGETFDEDNLNKLYIL